MTTPSLAHDLDKYLITLRQNETCFPLGPAVWSIIKIHFENKLSFICLTLVSCLPKLHINNY